MNIEQYTINSVEVTQYGINCIVSLSAEETGVIHQYVLAAGTAEPPYREPVWSEDYLSKTWFQIALAIQSHLDGKVKRNSLKR